MHKVNFSQSSFIPDQDVLVTWHALKPTVHQYMLKTEHILNIWVCRSEHLNANIGMYINVPFTILVGNALGISCWEFDRFPYLSVAAW